MSSSDKRSIANGKVYWKVSQRKDLQLSELGGALELVEVRFFRGFFFYFSVKVDEHLNSTQMQGFLSCILGPGVARLFGANHATCLHSRK